MLLSVEKLTKSFGGLMAVNGLDFTVREGEILGLIGPNGSGKTTVFNLITGFYLPDAGRIKLKAMDITGFKPHKVCASGIARTFQLVKPFAHLTALENTMVAKVYGREPVKDLKQAREEALALLDFVSLAGKEQFMAKNLTLVDRKRLELARALASKPLLLLLDELLAGLNPAETAVAMPLIERIRVSGVTVIMVEHIVKAVLGVSDRVIVLNVGEKIAEGTPQEIVKDLRVIEAYLGRAFRA